ncbi:MAG: hypothetical protein C4293_05140 [Nitrospiraceae bacterium]
MNIERAFRFSSILLTAIGFSGLVLTKEVPVGLVGLGLMALLIGWLILIGKAHKTLLPLSPLTWNILLLIAFLGFIADLLWISQGFLSSAIHFLIILMVNKLLHLERPKDFLHLYAISFLELLAAAALTGELWYGVVFVTYLFIVIWTLLLFHLYSEAEEAQSSVQQGQGSFRAQDRTRIPASLPPRFFWTTNGIALGALCLTLAIFLVIPRIGVGFFTKNRSEAVRTSGFSEKVDLGVIGAIKLDSTIVMRVEFPERNEPPAGRFYFRGVAYDHYNGRSWTNSSARHPVMNRTPDGGFLIDRRRIDQKEVGLRQDIVMEALDIPVLFGIPVMHSVTGNFLALQTDGMGGVYVSSPSSTRFRYSVHSFPDRISKEERTVFSSSYPSLVKARFLQLPELSPQVLELARQVTSDAQSPYEKALAVKQYLLGNYRYSLDVRTVSERSPVEEFLFTRKTGYCEHYATAMVVMLRTLGIPARLVTGFLPGEWNDFGNYYTVRQQDAHAWVEVFFPQSGWVTFDPTPSVAPSLSNPVWKSMSGILDSLRLKWDRFVIHYSFRDQMAIAQDVRERSDALRLEMSVAAAVMRNWAKAAMGKIIASQWMGTGVIVGLGLLLFLAGLIASVYRVRWQANSQTARNAVAAIYDRLLKLLESKGLRKAPGTTPLEFAKQVTREWAEAGELVNRLTQLYCRARFGEERLSKRDLQQVEELLTRLRATSR